MDGSLNSSHLNQKPSWLQSVVGLHASFVLNTHTAISPNRDESHLSLTRLITMTLLWLLVVLQPSVRHPCKMCQKRRNNRKLERFYDAKYIDKRIIGSSKKPKTASGQELSSGRRTRNTACVPWRSRKTKAVPTYEFIEEKKSWRLEGASAASVIRYNPWTMFSIKAKSV